ncbi:DMT family transporter [Cohaesibacter celericrescens]|jgi:small multidrug resistance pump|uniref:QacE family quaternary ammonium compound efflux SMR transporter n=1 Tax=Cohaesibacter celericrescens TaxID=2067669 RepID=A0A2N5XMB7_9HYPH|nr:SMR family transporter [Cohaesibacter celericrescens]PLW75580.1 QacE family quaternary ammonium compound efflux SMR transporter [Cohaesibacter celericrescens]
MHYIYLMIAIVGEVVGTSFMKQSDGFSKLGPSLVTAAGYLVAFYFLSLTLRTIPTGIAYAIWSGVGVVLITAGAWVFQGQRLDSAALIGMAFIVAGVIIMNVFSTSISH